MLREYACEALTRQSAATAPAGSGATVSWSASPSIHTFPRPRGGTISSGGERRVHAGSNQHGACMRRPARKEEVPTVNVPTFDCRARPHSRRLLLNSSPQRVSAAVQSTHTAFGGLLATARTAGRGTGARTPHPPTPPPHTRRTIRARARTTLYTSPRHTWLRAGCTPTATLLQTKPRPCPPRHERRPGANLARANSTPQHPPARPVALTSTSASHLDLCLTACGAS